ncbi:MAG: hypothetical protein CL512_04885 [Actinobacteria bacterium]|nr:hypothetical protein [Actinomycetota bacterium]
MRKDTRKVIEARMVEAIDNLGGVAHTQEVKDKILELEGATYEDFGRTKPNAKYPEGRFRFVESFAHIAKKMKNEGICFSPRRFYISTDPNAVAPEKEKRKKVTRKPRKKAEPVVEQEAQTIPSFMSQDEEDSYMASFPPITHLEEKELEEKEHRPPMARDEEEIADSDFLNPTSARSIYAYLDREKEVRVEVDEKGRAWEVDLTDEERAEFFPQNDLSPVEEAQVEEAQVEEAQVEEAQVEEAQVEEEVYTVSEKEESLNLEEVETFGIETQAWVDEEKEIRVGVDGLGLEYTRPLDMVDTVKKEEPQAEEYVLSNQEETQAEEYTISADEPPFEVEEAQVEVEVKNDAVEKVAEEVLSVLELDDLFDDEEEDNAPSEEEAQTIFLEFVEGNVWGAIEDGNVYLSEAQSGEVVLSFSEDVSPLDFLPDLRRKKQKLILEDAKKKGLKGYTSKILKVIGKTSERSQNGVEGWETHHVEGSLLGCFGAESVDRTQCSQVCALSAICMDAL